MHDLFRIENDRGLVQAFKEDRPIRDYAQQIHQTNLWVLPSGGISEDPALLSAASAQARFVELSKTFDFVLIDTVAMSVSPDAGVLGQLSDGVVLVLAAHSTTRDSALNTKVLLDEANVPIEGAVLNKQTYPIPDKVYRYL
jgi:Mrp family chromosome partitioning ATPase